MMSGTSGRRGSTSSASAALQRSLASRLRRRTVLLGSTLFTLTWKDRATPSGVWISALRASARPTSGNGCTLLESWSTPSAHGSAGEVSADLELHGKKFKNKKTGRVLQTNLATEAKMLAPWDTPKETDHSARLHHPERSDGGQPNLAYRAQLASWPTPDAHSEAPNSSTNRGSKWGGNRQRLTEQGLGNVAQLAPWPTPQEDNANNSMGHKGTVFSDLPTTAQMTGWTTPQAHDVTARGKGQKEKHGTRHGCADLNADVQAVASWATPRAADAESAGMRHSRGVADTLTAQASWATPSSRDWKDTPGMAQEAFDHHGKYRNRIDQLARQSYLTAGWQTPTATDVQRASSEAHEKRKAFRESIGRQSLAPGNLGEQVGLYAIHDQPARLTADGRMLIGSFAGMENGGQLNPAHSRWLQGLPEEWCVAAITAHRSIQIRRRKRGSED